MFSPIAEEVWNNAGDESLFDKLKKCREILSSWGQHVKGDFKQRIQSCKKAIKSMKGRKDSSSREVMKKEQEKLSEIYAQQEIFSRQRSKQLWLREGDQNRKFFHSSMKNRRTFNQIRSLKNDHGHEVEWNSSL